MAGALTSDSNCANVCVWGPAFLLRRADENVNLPVGEEKKYSRYKNQIFVSGLLPSCKCPLPFPPVWGPHSVRPATPAKADPPSLKGGGGEQKEEEAAETQCALYHFHAAVRHRQRRNTITLICRDKR